MGFNRREFLKGCCASTALGAGKPLMMFSGRADASAAGAGNTVVHVFLRGATVST